MVREYCVSGETTKYGQIRIGWFRERREAERAMVEVAKRPDTAQADLIERDAEEEAAPESPRPMMRHRRLLVDAARSIAALRPNQARIYPPIATGDDAHDINAVEAFIAQVALLAEGEEPGCHDGSTFAARRQAAQEIMVVWASL